MKSKQRVAQSVETGRGAISRSSARKSAKAKNGSAKPLSLMASVSQRGRGKFPPHADPEFYRPLKKPVTLRLDADVLAWFKKDGRRYQTRINQALRKVMERERKQPGG